MRAFAVTLLLAFAARATAAAPTIAWDEAEQHVGEEVTVEDRVLGVHCSPLSCLLAFEPTFGRFTAVVPAARFGTFPPAALEERFSGKRVRVHGTVTTNEHKPEIVVAAADDLVLVPEPNARERETEQTTRAMADALARLSDVLDRLENIMVRLAATQDRTEALLRQLEDRAMALAPSPPPATGTGPPPRPAYERLRSIKRGMAQADVSRLMGEPAWVEGTANGWTIWYYDANRSVTFDTRGRVQSLVGF
jgi:hypothetical protein